MLGGSGVSVQWEGEDTLAYEVGEGDCLVHLALENAHTLRAGPRASTSSRSVTARTRRGSPGPARRCRLARRDLGARRRRGGPPGRARRRQACPRWPSPRPANIVNVADLEPVDRDAATIGRRVRYPGREAGSVRTGLRHAGGPSREAERTSALPRSRGGDLRRARRRRRAAPLGGGRCRRASGTRRLGSSRPPSTGVAHAFRGGEASRPPHVRPREPGEVCYYPRSNKVYFIGLDLVTRVGEQLDYWEGED